MQLLSVNVGKPRTQPTRAGLEVTGIYKSPLPASARLTRLGFATDFIGDAKHHGGPDQAVFIYGGVDYEWWAQQLGAPLEPGTFGENLTVSGLESSQFSVGDRLQVGSTIVEITSPRTPCSTLARRMGDPMFVRKYRRAERPGLYGRVIQEGTVRPGDEVRLVDRLEDPVMVFEIFREHYALEKNLQTLRRFLAAPIAARTRADTEKRIQLLLARG